MLLASKRKDVKCRVCKANPMCRYKKYVEESMPAAGGG